MFLRFIFCIGFLVSCAKSPTLPIKGRILVKSGNSFKLEDVEFSTLSSLHPLKGDLGMFYGSGEFVPPGKVSRLGTPVNLDYTIENNVIVPRNFESLELLTLYHNLEVNVAFWKNLGLDWASFTRGAMPIMVDPEIKAEDDGVSLKLKFKGNEAYLRGIHGFFVFKASKYELTPIAMNPMVFAHEFGHAVFYAQLNQTYENATKDLAVVLKSMTEGLSDYFAYMVVGDTDILGQSLNVDLTRRRLPVPFKSTEAKELSENYYELGSVLASSLYEATQGTSAIDPSKLGQNIFKALAVFGEDVKASPTTVDMASLLQRILEQSTSAEKTTLCTSFLKWFDDTTTNGKLVNLCGK